VKAAYMSDLFFIDYEPKVMLSATVGMQRDTELAHRRLCDVVWKEGRPLDNSESMLREICRIEPHDWMRVKGELGQKGWKVEGKSFTHGGVIKTLERCRERYEKRVAAGLAGAEGRWGKQMPLQCDGNADAIREDCQSQSQSQSIKKKQAPKDLEEWIKTLAASPAYIGIDVKREFEKAKVWISLPQNKGRVLSQRFFVNWLNRLDRSIPVTGSPAPAISPNVAAIQNQRNLDRYEARLKALRELKPAMGWPKGAKELAETKMLKEEIEKLKTTMGLKA
jgi:hypothetical protein